ncbi:hypothetical protein AT6N2_C1871 [Agrobacterium tumefaciens]|nr:hypothetical protein AT6N2_C1871 [Agrobacterium tumefaciens]
MKRIARVFDRVQKRLIEGFVDFRPQPADMRFHDRALRIEIEVPDFFEKHRFRQDSALVAHEQFEKRKFTWQQVDPLPCTRCRSGDEVHLQVADAQARLLRGNRRAPNERIDSRRQFRKSEGLDQIIVTPRFQPFDTVVNTAHCGEKKDGDAYRGRAHALDQIEAVEAGDHAVHDGDVVSAVEAGRQRLAPVLHPVDRVAGRGQSLDNIVSRCDVVFYKKYLHGDDVVLNTALKKSHRF